LPNLQGAIIFNFGLPFVTFSFCASSSEYD